MKRAALAKRFAKAALSDSNISGVGRGIGVGVEAGIG